MDFSKFQNQVFFSTIRITVPNDDGNTSSIGTGFLFDVQLEEGLIATFLVSNKHVFGDPNRKIILNFHKKRNDVYEPELGSIIPVEIENFKGHYYGHPDPKIDLACINVSAFAGPENNVYSRHLRDDLIDLEATNNVLAGSEVSFIGYPDNRFDSVHNLPILRKGYLATLPFVHFNGMKQLIIDAQVYPGSSGSPVFVASGNRMKLLGVVTETMVKNAEVKAIPTEFSYGVQQTIGLGVVLKAELVSELLNEAKEGLNKKRASLSK